MSETAAPRTANDGRSIGATAANAVTSIRVLATPLFALAVTRRGSAWPVVVLYALAVSSDFADGRVARRWKADSAGGRLLDHFADIAFLLCALASYTAIGVLPWWVPVSVAGSFTVYVADSWLRGDGPRLHLAGSRIGHWAGIGNWVLVGVLVFDETAGLGWLPAGFLRMLYALVPMYSAAAVVQRLASRRAA
jgi:phosphatidylglycerophosphate synthase